MIIDRYPTDRIDIILEAEDQILLMFRHQKYWRKISVDKDGRRYYRLNKERHYL